MVSGAVEARSAASPKLSPSLNQIAKLLDEASVDMKDPIPTAGIDTCRSSNFV